MSTESIVSTDISPFQIRTKPRRKRRPGRWARVVSHWMYSTIAFLLALVLLFVWLQRSPLDVAAPVNPADQFSGPNPVGPAGNAMVPAGFLSEVTKGGGKADRSNQKSLARSLPKTLFDGKTLGKNDSEAADGETGNAKPATTFEIVNPIDRMIRASLQQQGIQPASRCDDATYLRRVYLDVLGTLPTLPEVRTFLSDSDPEKRSKLVEAVLRRPEYVDYATMRWCDRLRVKAEFPINLWPNAAQAYHHWIHRSIETNQPMDRFAQELLVASGSNFRSPPANFYRALQGNEPGDIATVVALTFLCERLDEWPQAKREGFTQFFTKVGYKPTGEWKEEIVYFDLHQADGDSPRDLEAVFPDGKAVTIPPDVDPRSVFADWLTDPRNPAFAKGIANRLWAHLMGRGIVEPVDHFGSDHPPSHPELLDWLAKELIDSGYDIKHLYRLILNSSAYGQSCVPKGDSQKAEKWFACYIPRRMDAEVLIDAICQITGTTETYMSIIPEPYTFLPNDQRAISLPDGSISSSFLEMFGRPARDTGMASERNNRLTAAQTLHLLNSNHVRDKLKKGPAAAKLYKGKTPAPQRLNQIYMTVLSRRPSDDEVMLGEPMCRSASGSRDLIWALINCDEFLFRH
ncbi:DUF1553 domain-containing protein [Crateriforma conspicua]|uniref:DUF1553 domain-containing protein n=1 Tax=Crateriforma conspicua TaxID=2527996 RepID=A0A5C6FRA9_9PLAN|nr:DUF1553 domain-containing protein [Crateriforma conspicua]TWU65702.1 hypothetical protein V7x_12510 [Crateriforma conspicua]